MTPAQAIAALDRHLARHGRTMRLVRAAGGLADGVGRGFARDFKPEELVGSIQQGDRLAILSPTWLGPIGWLAVKAGDRVNFGQRWYRVQAPDLIEIGDTVVRVELHLRGM